MKLCVYLVVSPHNAMPGEMLIISRCHFDSENEAERKTAKANAIDKIKYYRRANPRGVYELVLMKGVKIDVE